MEAHSLSPRRALPVSSGHESNIRNRSSAWFEGDFAAGLRGSGSDAGVRGDFATGIRSTPLGKTIGDYATGLRARPAAELVRGDFATCQRADRTDTRSRIGQPARHGPSRLRHNTATVVEPGRP
jgi:hypothetical protein